MYSERKQMIIVERIENDNDNGGLSGCSDDSPLAGFVRYLEYLNIFTTPLEVSC